MTPNSAAQLLLAQARYGTKANSSLALASVVCPEPTDNSNAESEAEEEEVEGSGEVKPKAEAPRGNMEALLNAAWALGVLEHAQAPVTQRIVAAAAKALGAAMGAAAAAAGGAAGAARPPPARLLRKAYHAQLLLQHGGGELPLDEDVASAAAAEWAVALWPDETAGRVQSRFTKFLDAMEVPYAANVPAADGRLRIDVLLRRSMDQVSTAARLLMPHPVLITNRKLHARGFQAYTAPNPVVRSRHQI